MSFIHEDHIWELCDQHDITVRWHRGYHYNVIGVDGGYYGTASGSREIRLGWRAEGEDPYWVALHEIAHIALDLLGLTGAEKMKAEAECWAWALQHARTPPSMRLVQRMAKALESYSISLGRHPRQDEVIEEYRQAAVNALL